MLQFLCALEKFSDIGRSSVGLGSPGVYPGVLHADATLSVGVLRTLVNLCENVDFVGPGWTLKRSSCILDEEGVEFIWIFLSEE